MIPYLPEFFFSKPDSSIDKQTQLHIEQSKFQLVTSVHNFPFHEYLILNLINQNLHIRQEIAQLKHALQDKDTAFKDSQTQARTLKLERKKRKYNKKAEILQRKFVCDHKDCNRSYSSRIALNSHLRKKHSGKSVCSVENTIEQ